MISWGIRSVSNLLCLEFTCMMYIFLCLKGIIIGEKKKTKLNGTENFLNLEKRLDITYALISHLKVVKYLSSVLFVCFNFVLVPDCNLDKTKVIITLTLSSLPIEFYTLKSGLKSIITAVHINSSANAFNFCYPGISLTRLIFLQYNLAWQLSSTLPVLHLPWRSIIMAQKPG